MRIRRQLSIAFILIAVMTIGATLAVNVPILWSESTQEAFDNLNSIATIQKASVISTLTHYDERISYAIQLAPGSYLVQYQLNSSFDIQNALYPIFIEMMETTPSVNSISIASTEGEIITSTDLGLIGENISQESYFIRGLARTRVMDEFHLDTSMDLHLILAGTIIENNTVVGVLIIDLSPVELVTLFQQYAGLGQSGEAILVAHNPDGDVVVVTPTRHNPDSSLGIIIPANHTFDPAIKALSGIENTFTNVTDYRGTSVLASTKYIEQVDWGIVVKIDLDEAFHSARLVLLTHIITSIAIAVLFIVIGYLIISMITNPILELKKVAVAISDGDYSQKAKLGQIDELNMLAESFNQMTETLLRRREELERLVRERTKEYERSNMELEQFAYVISHDLREPLRMIVSYMQLLETRHYDQLDDSAKEYISFAIDGSKRMNQMIMDLLAYSRVGRENIEFELLDLNEVVSIAIQNMKVLIEEKQASIEVGELPEIHGCRTHIAAVFQNLISNAIKYNESETPTIQISAKPENGKWHFIVEDNGIGIDPKYHERIFQIFRKLHSRAEYEGSGIGLSLCKKIIEYHGGNIWVESELGKGSEFHFVLPAGVNR